MNDHDEFVPMPNAKFTFNHSKIIKKDTDDSSAGIYKLIIRKDDNINLVIDVNDKKMAWTIDIKDTEDIYNLFGKAGKVIMSINFRGISLTLDYTLGWFL